MKLTRTKFECLHYIFGHVDGDRHLSILLGRKGQAFFVADFASAAVPIFSISLK